MVKLYVRTDKMNCRRRSFRKNWTIIFVSLGIAFLVIAQQSWRQTPIGSSHEHMKNAIFIKLTKFDENIRTFMKNTINMGMDNPHDPSTCDINFLPRGFVTTGEYEDYFVNQSTIYSEDYLEPAVKVKPIYNNVAIRLDPDRFLYPIVFRGPNNQLLGLWEAIYVAIRLNRTLVIPRFEKHFTDKQFADGHAIHPAHRVNLQTMCEFVSCITLQQFRKACGNKADIIMRLREYPSFRIGRMESLSGLRFSQVRDAKHKALKFLPPRSRKPTDFDGQRGEVHFGPEEDEIRSLFGSTERCAIYPQPFLNLKMKRRPSQRRITENSDIRTFSNSEVFSQIIQETQTPKYIQNMAKTFIKSVLKGQLFLAVHWRYDQGDWMKRCDRLTADQALRGERCDATSKLKPSDIAQAILDKLDASSKKIGIVYIAAPPNQKFFTDGIKDVLNEHDLVVYRLDDVTKFLKGSFDSCDFLRKHEGDINSSIDMQICRKSFIFMRSPSSSWSSNILDWRKHDKIPRTSPTEDADVLNPAIKIMTDRLGAN